MLMGWRTTLPSAETPLDFYIRVIYAKRVGILVDVGEAAGYDCVHMWFLELTSAEEKTLAKPESRHIKLIAGVEETSNASVYSGDRFTKIKIQPLNSHPHTANKQRLSPNDNFCYKDWGDKVLNDTYMRFSEDILMVDYRRFDLLYRHGGSLNLERLTHIAVSWFGYLSVSTPWISGKITKLLNDTYSQCPCLKRLSVLGSRICDEKAPPVTRLLNIDKDLLKLDLEDIDGRQVPSEETDDRHFESYRKEIEEEGNKNAIEYWNKVEVVNVLQCWSDGTQYESTLYFQRLTPLCAATMMDSWQRYQKVRQIV
ncbi:hypothetical protein EAF00_009856 [Botryotinia globosa]|nr:hypothetical protein EAF00_009856 [Botryotinia globosa]